jgi:hypothetical protein
LVPGSSPGGPILNRMVAEISVNPAAHACQGCRESSSGVTLRPPSTMASDGGERLDERIASRSSLSAGGARAVLDHSQGGAWVEGALTSGCGLGAICRPLTDWPWFGGSADAAVEPPFARGNGAVRQLPHRRPAPKAPQSVEAWLPGALDSGLSDAGKVLPN